MTAEHAFDTPNYQATSAQLAKVPDRCPGYECLPGRTWTEAHRDDPGDPGYPPGHFWYADGQQSYMAHGDGTGLDPDPAATLQPFAQPAPVTPAEAATAQVLEDLAAPPAAVDLDQLADPAPLAWYTAIEGWDAEIAALEDQIVPLKEKRERASEIIQAAMGDAEEARIKGRPVVTWKTSKPAQRLDRKALEAAYGADVIAGFLVDNKAARPFKILPRRGGAR
jgi:hypothetical protein